MATMTRRSFLENGGSFLGVAGMVMPIPLWEEGKGEAVGVRQNKKTPEVSPTEDLMREHGVLSRILLIHRDICSRIKENKSFPPQVLVDSVGLIRRFIEDYHEKLEEEHIFPRFEKAGKLTDIVKVLREQHQAGRAITDAIQNRLQGAGLNTSGDREEVSKYLSLFARMYRPHKAREDTILFPALHSLVSPAEFDRLGDEFEGREQTLFGKGGFKKIVAEVAGLEEILQIHSLAEFTPKEP